MANRTGPGLITGFLVGIATVLVVAAIAGFGVVYSGAYNVAATEPQTAFGRWALDTTYHRSIRARASDVATPELTEAMVRSGAAEYGETCVHCHGAPGQEADHWSRGMRPEPPELVEAAAEWSPAQVFWILEHGVKMSGMPSFAEHPDEENWAIAAFVQRLPAMTSEEYRAYVAAAPEEGEEGSEGNETTQ